jgi:diguanylate cyclase (GGDEF)-like protein/PAS domain S-box-containing protein
MEFEDKLKNRLGGELDAIRKQIADLKGMMLEPAPAAAVCAPASDAEKRALERIMAEMEAQIGFFPPFLAPVAEMPEVLATLWLQMRVSYLKNPIPALTKEKLFARLSRACPVSYALVSHSCHLRNLGMRADEILRWLELPAPAAEEELAQSFAGFAPLSRPLSSWPEPGSPPEDGLLKCSVFLFLNPSKSSRCRAELLTLLGPAKYGQLTAFLAYVKMHHLWLAAYPEPAQDSDEIIQSNLRRMLEEEPRLDSLFKNYFEEQPLPLAVPRIGPAPGEGEPLLPAILDQGPLGVAILDPDYRILKANQVLCQLLGYLEHELEALSLPAIAHPQDVGDYIHRIDQVLSGARARARVEKRLLKRTKEIVWVELTAAAVCREDGSPLYSLAFIEDITERKQEEDMRHGEKHLFERLLQNSQDGIFGYDRELICTLWSPAMEQIFGIEEKNALGSMIFDVFPFLVETGADKHLLETLRGETLSVRDCPFRVPATGKEGFYDAHYSPLINYAGKASGGIAFVRDVTERRKAEDGQRATEERYRELFENANDIVYTHDLTGHITSLNKAAERITGYSREEALQMKAGDMVSPRHVKIACKMIERQIAGESPAPYELELICKDGRQVAVEVSTHIIYRNGTPVGVQGIARDITERKKTEEALQQAKQNLEAWVHELEQRTQEMTLLSEMGDMLRACLSTDEAYSVIVRVAQQIFPVQVGALFVISPSRNLVEAVAVWGDAALVERVFAADECWALRRGRVHWVEDTRVGLLCKHLNQPPPEGYLCVPMMAQSEALGILYLAQPANARLTEAKQRLAMAMAEHIAMALSNLKLHETLRSQSIRDPLTGLFNRRFMEESLELELRRATRNRRPLGVIMFEVDSVQSETRPIGADAEDSILREIGGLLQTIIRKEDIACRFGGEKFTIILPQGSLEITAQRTENLRGMIKDLEIRHRGRALGHVTVSAGIAVFPEQGRTVEALIRVADAALQRAKQDGGDRIVIAQ